MRCATLPVPTPARAGKPVIAASGGGLPGPGYTFICDESMAAPLWKALSGVVSRPLLKGKATFFSR